MPKHICVYVVCFARDRDGRRLFETTTSRIVTRDGNICFRTRTTGDETRVLRFGTFVILLCFDRSGSDWIVSVVRRFSSKREGLEENYKGAFL